MWHMVSDGICTFQALQLEGAAWRLEYFLKTRPQNSMPHRLKNKPSDINEPSPSEHAESLLLVACGALGTGTMSKIAMALTKALDTMALSFARGAKGS